MYDLRALQLKTSDLCALQLKPTDSLCRFGSQHRRVLPPRVHHGRRRCGRGRRPGAPGPPADGIHKERHCQRTFNLPH